MDLTFLVSGKNDEPPTPEPRFGVPNTALINEKTPESELNVDVENAHLEVTPDELLNYHSLVSI